MTDRIEYLATELRDRAEKAEAEVERLRLLEHEFQMDERDAKAQIESLRLRIARLLVMPLGAAVERAEKAEAEIRRLRNQLDDLRIIQDDYPCTTRGTEKIEEFIKATMDDEWTQHADPRSIPWLTLGDWLCELRDYRKALGVRGLEGRA